MSSERFLATWVAFLFATVICLLVVPALPWPPEWRQGWGPDRVGAWLAWIGSIGAVFAAIWAARAPAREARVAARGLVFVASVQFVEASNGFYKCVQRDARGAARGALLAFQAALRVAKDVKLEHLSLGAMWRYSRVLALALLAEEQLQVFLEDSDFKGCEEGASGVLQRSIDSAYLLILDLKDERLVAAFKGLLARDQLTCSYE